MEHCDRFLALISQALDEELPLEDQQALAGHLAQCPQCRELQRQLEEIQDEFTSWAGQEVPDGFTQGVMDRVRALPSSNVRPFWRRPQVRALGSLAACMLICVGVLRSGFGRSGQSAAPASAEMAVSDIAADSQSAASSTALLENRDESESGSDSDSVYYTVTSGASLSGSASQPDEPAAQSDQASSKSADSSSIVSQSAPASQDSMLFSSQPQAYAIESRCATAPEPDSQSLLQSVAATLGQEPGILLVIGELPSQCEDDGQWYCTEDGYAVLVLDESPDDELYQTLIQDSLLCLEVGEGAFALLIWPQ